jgi:hypothetical protein
VEGEKSDGLTRLASITTTCISPTLELMKLPDISDMTFTLNKIN